MDKSSVSLAVRLALLVSLAVIGQGGGSAPPLAPGQFLGRTNAFAAPEGTAPGTPKPPDVYVAEQLDDDAFRVIAPDGTHGVISSAGFTKISRAEANALVEAPKTAAPSASSATKATAIASSNPSLGQQEQTCQGIVIPEDPAQSSPLNPLPPVPPIAPAQPVPTEPTRAPASSGNGVPAPAVPPSAPVLEPVAVQPLPTSVRPDPITVLVPTSNSGGAVSTSGNTMWSTLDTASDVAERARGQELVAAAEATRAGIVRDAAQDQNTLAEPYRNMSSDALAANLERAQTLLSQATDVLENAKTSSLENSEKARFHNVFMNARDKAQLGLDTIKDSEQGKNQLGDDSPFAGLIAAKDANPLAKSPALAAIFGPQLAAANAATPDALVNRLVMLNGLPADLRAASLQKLKLLERPTFVLPNGNLVTIELPHNGYLLGGGATAVDCSSFVSSVLPVDVRRGRFTSLDFRMMWIYDRTEAFPKPPKYAPEREKLVKETAPSFIPINIYVGEAPRGGDLLIYRMLADPIGHVMIVRSYNAVTLRAEIIEAAQSSSTVRERTLDLSADPLDAPRRLLMPGLFDLRLKPVSTHGCYYRDAAHSSHGTHTTGTAGGAQ